MASETITLRDLLRRFNSQSNVAYNAAVAALVLSCIFLAALGLLFWYSSTIVHKIHVVLQNLTTIRPVDKEVLTTHIGTQRIASDASEQRIVHTLKQGIDNLKDSLSAEVTIQSAALRTTIEALRAVETPPTELEKSLQQLLLEQQNQDQRRKLEDADRAKETERIANEAADNITRGVLSIQRNAQLGTLALEQLETRQEQRDILYHYYKYANENLGSYDTEVMGAEQKVNNGARGAPRCRVRHPRWGQ